MEQAQRGAGVQAPYQWDDVGSWLALERRNPQDADGNTVQAHARRHQHVRTASSSADPGRLIATIGVSNLLIIQDGDATLVADRRDEGDGQGTRRAAQEDAGPGEVPVSAARTRLLGVDYGTVRIGLAVSDPDRIIASPLEVRERQGPDRDAAYFRQLVEREEIGGLVVGLPLHTTAARGPRRTRRGRSARGWRGVTGLPVVYSDERFTTAYAESALWAAGLTHKKRKDRRDAVAAQMMLQAYLDAGCPAEVQVKPLEG